MKRTFHGATTLEITSPSMRFCIRTEFNEKAPKRRLMAKSAFIVNPKNKETLHPPGRFGFLRCTIGVNLVIFHGIL